MENAERAGVEVHEAGMHDGGAFGKVGTQTHAVGVADTHAGRHHIVDHARELVDRQHVHVHLRQSRNALVSRGHHVKLAQREILDRERAIIGPYHIVEGCENAVQIQGVRLGETHAQQMQTQVCVGCVFDRFVKLRHREHRNAAHATRIDALMGEIAKSYGSGVPPPPEPRQASVSGYHTSKVLPAASTLDRPQPHAVR